MKMADGDAINIIVQTLAHDVKTPLTSILGFTQLLLEDARLTPKQREYLEMIEADAKHLNEIVLSSLTEIDAVTAADSK